MKLLLALFVITFSTLVETMVRSRSMELKQRSHQTVTPKNRLSRSTSEQLKKVGQALKKSASSSTLSSLAITKPAESTYGETNLTTSTKLKKLQFDPFIDKELFKLTTNFGSEAETALMDGDSKKFQDAYKRMDSPRAQQAILSKAEQYRGLDPQFCHVIVLLQKEVDEKNNKTNSIKT